MEEVQQEAPVTREEFEELQETVEETLKVEKENNKYIKSIRRWSRISFWTKILLWGIVLLGPILLYAYYAPFLKEIPGLSFLAPSGSSFMGLPSPATLEQFFHHSTTTPQ